jgi:hypothetical protein
MFSDEVAVTYPPSAGNQWQKSVFVPSSYVRGAENDGQVRVDVLTQDGTQYAVLPSSRRDIVKIEGADLVQP